MFALIAGLLCGIAWTSWYASTSLQIRLPERLESQPIQIEGIISSIPIPGQYGVNFLFAVNHMNDMQVRLTWNTEQKLHVGDHYLLTVRLKHIHAMRNPGTYNYETWAFENHIMASGSVLSTKQQRFIDHTSMYPFNRLRQFVHDLLLEHLPQTTTSGWILALTIGERYMASQKDWQILRATGTNHLMAIAGLHIGLIAGFTHLVSSYLWRQSIYLCYLIPSDIAAGIMSIAVAWIYSALAGFALPTQRACLMVTIFLVGSLSRISFSGWQSWSLALFFVLMINPLSSLSESFWLSFLTIALIIYGMQGRLHPNNWWWKWFRVQWVIGVGLTPVALYFFQQTSLTGFLANSIAIPWLGFVVLPLCLTASILLLLNSVAAHVVLILADKSLFILWRFLEYVSELCFSVWLQPINSMYLLAATAIACLVFLAPRGMPGRLLSAIWILPLLLHEPARPAQSDYWFTVLDAGQGMSAIIQTRNHTLIYDAGAKFSDKFDIGDNVVVPFLNASGVKNVDMLVISHADNDHAGGMQAVMRSLKVKLVRSGATKKLHLSNKQACISGESWQWDGVNFEFIYPTVNELDMGNDGSCVLKVSASGGSVLLTGDIEKYAESLIITRNKGFAVNIMTAPHHGSKTSGLSSFLDRVDPQYVIISAGYRNRYRLPHQSILRDYARRGVLVLNTATSGAIQFRISSASDALIPYQYRYANQYYWG